MNYRRTLAVDTSTKSQVLALLDGDEVVARRLTRVRTNHSETLLRNIADMLDQAGWSRASVDLVAAGLGPGTFTGLRVGLATAKAFAVGVDAHLVGVSSLAATARPVSALFEGVAFALCDARRGELYRARYRVRPPRRDTPGLFECEAAPSAMPPDEVVREVMAASGPVLLIGNGLRRYEELRTIARPELTVLSQPWDGPSGASIGLLGRQLALREGPADVASLEPNYVRPSDAERDFGPPDTSESELR